uniref:Peroxiredoxin-1 n=2 Tax=Cyprinus carpio TaxID=7962 RepID=A0A9J8BWS6_CYPCA
MSSGNAKIGQPAPQFKATAVVDGQFKDTLHTLCNLFSLHLYFPSISPLGKYVVLFFYPLDFTFVCPTEIIAFSERAAEFRKIGCEVIAASTDSHFSHLAWINTPRKQGGLGSMNIPLVADLTQSISRDYGVLKEDEGLAYRGLFVIDDKGILRQITINDLPVGRSVDETLRLVQAFQHTDKYGEVCPAGWKPGSDTIVPDVQKSKEFFSKQ